MRTVSFQFLEQNGSVVGGFNSKSEHICAVEIDAIAKSFKPCALNLAVDGTEDSKIHCSCFKEGQPCEAGSEQLQAQLSVLDEHNLPNAFQDITDSDIEESTEESNMVDQDDDEDIVIDL